MFALGFPLIGQVCALYSVFVSSYVAIKVMFTLTDCIILTHIVLMNVVRFISTAGQRCVRLPRICVKNENADGFSLAEKGRMPAIKVVRNRL